MIENIKNKNTLSELSGGELDISNIPLTLYEVIKLAASNNDQDKILFLSEKEKRTLSYSNLFLLSKKIIKQLNLYGINDKNIVILNVLSKYDFIVYFWACMIGNITVLPVIDNGENDSVKLKDKLDKLYSYLGNAFIISDSQFSLESKTIEKSKILYANEIKNLPFDNLITSNYSNNPDNIVLLMSTSGSTGEPKIVKLTHHNIITSILGYSKKLHLTSNEITLNWASFDHVAGLVYFHIRDTFLGCQQLHIQADVALSNPVNWFQLIHDHRVTITFSPNFIFNTITKHKKDLAKRDFDLSCIKYLLSCGEPIMAKSVEQFLIALKDYRLHETCIIPAWGMTETSSAIITYDGLSFEKLSQSKMVVEVGSPIPGISIRIVNDNNEMLPTSIEGHLQVKGYTITSGYYNNETETADLFTHDGWLKTGDLGYIENGSLTVTGRSKQIIIINGKNYSCVDLEKTISDIKDIAINDTAVFSIADETKGTEQFICMFTYEKKLDDIAIYKTVKTIKSEILKKYGLYACYVIPIDVKDLIKTNIGKINRDAMRKKFEQGMFEEIIKKVSNIKEMDEGSNETVINNKIEKIWKEVLGIKTIKLDQNFFEQGGDSILAMQLIAKIKKINSDIYISTLYNNPVYSEFVKAVTYEQKTDSPSMIKHDHHISTIIPELRESQKQILYHSLTDPNDSTYHLPFAFKIEGIINFTHLKKSFLIIINKHPIFKTSFYNDSVQPKIKINKNYKLKIKKVKINSSTHDLTKIIKKEANKPFNLEESPLLRVTWFECNSTTNVLLVVFHHAIIDDHGCAIFFDELSKAYNDNILYDKINCDKCISITSIGFDCRSHAVKEIFWNNQFKLIQEKTPFNLSIKPTSDEISTGRQKDLLISKKITSNLKNIAHENKTTLFTVLLSAFNILLYKYKHDDLLIIGSPFTSRYDYSFDNYIGYFIDILPIVSKIYSSDSFVNYIHIMHDKIIDIHANKDCPIFHLYDSANTDNKTSKNMFEIVFAMQNEAPKIKLKNCKSRFMRLDYETCKFPLTVYAIDNSTSLRFVFEYSIKLYKDNFIDQMKNDFIKLLDYLSTNKDKPLKDFSFGNNKTKESSLKKISTYFINKSLSETIEDQVKVNLNKIAIKHGSHYITYKNLNDSANQIANFIDTTFPEETMIGIYLPKSVEYVVTMLAVLKTGRTYVPLDTNINNEWVKKQVDEIQLSIIFTTNIYKNNLLKHNLKIIVIDDSKLKRDGLSKEYIRKTVHLEMPAYIIFTSGSSGDPKPVMISGESILNLVFNISHFSITKNDILAWASNPSFDATIFELFGALTHGCTLVIIDNECLLDIKNFRSSIDKEKITIMFLTTAVFTQIINIDSSIFEHLRVLIIGGEMIDPKSIKLIVNSNKSPQLIVCAYGPTETTCMSSMYIVDKNDYLYDITPIGSAIGNTELYILDNDLNIMPENVIGEIYIAGKGVMLGYRNNIELTNEKIVNNPNSDIEIFSRIYKTGDLGYKSNKLFFTTGRIDNQIKLNGHRINMEIIETSLMNFSSILQCKVFVKSISGAKKLFVAYTSKNGLEINDDRLTNFLSEKIPYYMLPSGYIYVHNMPLNDSGKIDINALNKIFDLNKKHILVCHSIESDSENEISIIKACRAILEQPNFNRDSNFFLHGGDSISSLRLIHMLSLDGLYVKPSDIKNFPTPKMLASHVTSEIHEHKKQIVLKDKDYPLSPIQAMFFDKHAGIIDGFCQGIILKCISKSNEKNVKARLFDITEKHPEFKLRFRKNKNGWVQYYAKSSHCYFYKKFEMYSKKPITKKYLNTIQSDLSASISITDGPLMAIGVVTNKNNFVEYLVIILHHLIIDGVSWRIIIDELNSHDTSTFSETGDTQTPFTEWAAYLNKIASNNYFYDDEQYWQNTVVDAKYLNLKNNHLKHKKTGRSQLTFRANATLTSYLLDVLPLKYDLTTFSVLLSCFGSALSEVNDQNAITLMLERHGRELITDEFSLANTIGWFTNMFLFNLSIDIHDTLIQNAIRLKSELNSIPNYGLGYLCLNYLSSQTSIKHINPDISFNYMGVFSKNRHSKFLLTEDNIFNLYDEHCNIFHNIDICCGIYNSELNIDVSFNNSFINSNEINEIFLLFLNKLDKLDKL